MHFGSLFRFPFFHCTFLWLLRRRWSFHHWFSSIPPVTIAISDFQLASILRLSWVVGAIPRLTIPRILSWRLSLASLIVLISSWWWWSLHSLTIRRMMSLLLIPWIVLSIVGAIVFLVVVGVAFVLPAMSIGLLRIRLLAIVLSIVLSRRLLLGVALVVLLVSIAIAHTMIAVVLAALLIYIVSIVFISSTLLLRVSVALDVRLIVVVVLLLRGIASILWVHRSLLVLIIVGLTRSVVRGSLIIGHAARAMAVGVACDCVREVELVRGLHSSVVRRQREGTGRSQIDRRSGSGDMVAVSQSFDGT